MWDRPFAAVAHGRDNNFNLLRMSAATAVLVSHSFPLAAGIGTLEPLQKLTGFSLGSLAVQIFFAVSGFFIAKSFDRRSSTIDFITARVLRLYPALLTCLLVTAWLLGPVVTILPPGTYVGARQSWSFVPVNLSLRVLQEGLPGVFLQNPFPASVNGSLWTLYSEVKCYALAALIGLGGLLDPRRFWIAGAAMIAYQVHGRVHDPFARNADFVALSLPFFVGTACYVYRNRVPYNGWIAIGAIAAAAASRSLPPLYPITLAVALGYGSLWLGYARIPGLRLYNRLGDYSYGVYIYAWPVQQTAVKLLSIARPGVLIAVAIPVTTCLATLSWKFVEEPALRHRHRTGRKLAASFLNDRRAGGDALKMR